MTGDSGEHQQTEGKFLFSSLLFPEAAAADAAYCDCF